MKQRLGSEDGDLRTNFELDKRRASNPFKYENTEKDDFME